jgi:hypothetical protein
MCCRSDGLWLCHWYNMSQNVRMLASSSLARMRSQDSTGSLCPVSRTLVGPRMWWTIVAYYFVWQACGTKHLRRKCMRNIRMDGVSSDIRSSVIYCQWHLCAVRRLLRVVHGPPCCTLSCKTRLLQHVIIQPIWTRLRPHYRT